MLNPSGPSGTTTEQRTDGAASRARTMRWDEGVLREPSWLPGRRLIEDVQRR